MRQNFHPNHLIIVELVKVIIGVQLTDRGEPSLENADDFDTFCAVLRSQSEVHQSVVLKALIVSLVIHGQFKPGEEVNACK